MTPRTSRIALCISLLLSSSLSMLLGLSAAATGTAAQPVGAALSSPHTPAGRWVPSGAAAFDHLSRKPDALGIQRTALAPEPSTFMHYQGIARVDAADGTPYFIISKGGVGAVDDEPGYLTVARMGSRDRDGERLRTNLYPGTCAANLAQDQTILSIALDGTNGWPARGIGRPGHVATPHSRGRRRRRPLGDGRDPSREPAAGRRARSVAGGHRHQRRPCRCR